VKEQHAFALQMASALLPSEEGGQLDLSSFASDADGTGLRVGIVCVCVCVCSRRAAALPLLLLVMRAVARQPTDAPSSRASSSHAAGTRGGIRR
jgi:hypothetical protein